MFRRLILRGLAFAFGAVVRLRHGLFDLGILPSRPGALKTIVLGNLTVGGTGKTPTTERIARDLQNIIGLKKIGILSRGYGRKTKGFHWVSSGMEAIECGDEPLLLRKNLPDVPVAVCENRLKGLRRMKAEHPELEWVVCDDAFQHRRLKPTISLLLLDVSQPIAADSMLPAGRLRDLPERMHHADALVITRLDPSASLDEAASAHGIAESYRPAFVCLIYAASAAAALAFWRRSTQWRRYTFTRPTRTHHGGRRHRTPGTLHGSTHGALSGGSKGMFSGSPGIHRKGLQALAANHRRRPPASHHHHRKRCHAHQA
jgi:tetraacyldisaccharide 4'-kinase